MAKNDYVALTSFKDRVILEKVELDSKLVKLGLFLGTEAFHALDQAEQVRLERQQLAMSEYSAILGERIAAFS